MEPRNVKGSHIVQAKEWVDTRLGPNAFAELTRHGGGAWSIILPMGWYEVDVLNKPHKEAPNGT